MLHREKLRAAGPIPRAFRACAVPARVEMNTSSPLTVASASIRKKINISTVLAGQKVGLKEGDEAIWLVSFMHYDLGYIDLEQRTLQPLDNPFGTRLSPMS